MKGIHSNPCLCLTSSWTKAKVKDNNKYCIDSGKVNLTEALCLKYTKILSPDETWALHDS